MTRLTLAGAERQLRALLRSGGVAVKTGALDGDAGRLAFGGNGLPHLIGWNPTQGGMIETVVHELIHLAYRKELLFWGVFEEDLVCALEDRLVRYLNDSPQRRERWTNAIAKKLKGSE